MAKVMSMNWASEGAQLIDSGLSIEVVETILHSRAPSTRKLYALKWKLFRTQSTAQWVQCWSEGWSQQRQLRDRNL